MKQNLIKEANEYNKNNKVCDHVNGKSPVFPTTTTTKVVIKKNTYR